MALLETRKARLLARRERLEEAANCLCWGFRYHALGELADPRAERVFARLIRTLSDLQLQLGEVVRDARTYRDQASRRRVSPRRREGNA